MKKIDYSESMWVRYLSNRIASFLAKGIIAFRKYTPFLAITMLTVTNCFA